MAFFRPKPLSRVATMIVIFTIANMLLTESDVIFSADSNLDPLKNM